MARRILETFPVVSFVVVGSQAGEKDARASGTEVFKVGSAVGSLVVVFGDRCVVVFFGHDARAAGD